MKFCSVRLAATVMLLLSAQAASAARVIRAEIHSTPQSTQEYGFIYASTGWIPARLELYCKDFIDEDSWNGTLPGDTKGCGGMDLQMRMKSVGLSAYFVEAHKPLTISLYVDPDTTPLRSIVGVYVGAKLGVGIAAGARTAVLLNKASGALGVIGQALFPSGETLDSPLDIGVDLSVPWLEVYLQQATDLSRPISSFKKLQ